MSPGQAIADLDARIAEDGQTVYLRDVRAPANDPANNPGKALRAFVRGYKPDELAGGVNQGDSTAIISPTSLGSTGIDALKRYGKITIAGRLRTINVANPVTMGDVVVRWELWVTG